MRNEQSNRRAWNTVFRDLRTMETNAAHDDERRTITTALNVALQMSETTPAPVRVTAVGERARLVITLYWRDEEVECTSEEVSVFRR